MIQAYGSQVLPPQTRRSLLVIGPLILGVSGALGQAAPTEHPPAGSSPPTTLVPTQPLAFGVVSIKPHGQGTGWNLQPTPDGYEGQNISLFYMVQEAYGDVFRRDPKLITGGPEWIDEDKFDLEAKFDPADIPGANALSSRQRADMLRAVLADRFRLKVHFETKEFPVYNLVVAKGGPKLTETKPEDLSSGMSGSACVHRRDVNFNFSAVGCRTKDLENLLLYTTGRTVIDKTGLAGRYDIKLRYAPPNTPADAPADRPSIFTAVQEQLGLKLEPATAFLDVLVIDSAERPTAN